MVHILVTLTGLRRFSITNKQKEQELGGRQIGEQLQTTWYKYSILPRNKVIKNNKTPIQTIAMEVY